MAFWWADPAAVVVARVMADRRVTEKGSSAELHVSPVWRAAVSSLRKSRGPGCYTSNPISRVSCRVRVDVVSKITKRHALRRTGELRRCLKEGRSRAIGSTPTMWSLTALGIYHHLATFCHKHV
jgi:hypothetical protein